MAPILKCRTNTAKNGWIYGRVRTPYIWIYGRVRSRTPNVYGSRTHIRICIIAYTDFPYTQQWNQEIRTSVYSPYTHDVQSRILQIYGPVHPPVYAPSNIRISRTLKKYGIPYIPVYSRYTIPYTLDIRTPFTHPYLQHRMYGVPVYSRNTEFRIFPYTKDIQTRILKIYEVHGYIPAGVFEIHGVPVYTRMDRVRIINMHLICNHFICI